MSGTQKAVDGCARAPRDIPVIMSRPMVLATLEDRKTATRRLAWKDAEKRKASSWQHTKPGDRLWVRESLSCAGDGTWRHSADDSAITMHRSDPRSSTMVAWAHHQERSAVPSIHMPRWASRLTLIVTGVKIERLQDISEEDALSEGVQCLGGSFDGCYVVPGTDAMSGTTASECFRRLWCGLHGDSAWEQNPEVLAISFRAIKANIDSPEARAAA